MIEGVVSGAARFGSLVSPGLHSGTGVAAFLRPAAPKAEVGPGRRPSGVGRTAPPVCAGQASVARPERRADIRLDQPEQASAR